MNQHTPVKPVIMAVSSADPDAYQLAACVRDFLYALDRGDYGDALRHGHAEDRYESAFVTAMREALAPFDTERFMADLARKRGAALAAALYGEVRS